MCNINAYNYQMEDTLWHGLTDEHCKTSMGVTAENLAEKYQITRKQCGRILYTFTAQLEGWLVHSNSV